MEQKIKIESYDKTRHIDLSLFALEQEYLSSFPEEERRDWTGIISEDFQGQLYIITSEGTLLGFVTLWNILHVCYVEHLLIMSACRGQGIGAEVVQALQSHAGDRTLLLECEPAYASSMAQRRLDFYARLGFIMQDIDYIQPPYVQGGDSVPLHLLATEVLDRNLLDTLVKELHKVVYRVG